MHHGLWDYDPASAPNLVTITVDGKRIDAVVQLTKQGFAFVFDRVTGEPVWPIEERPVPRSDVPGEASWPTQPFPTRPPAFEAQGVTLDDAFDLTPELKQAAQAEMKKYRLGPLYTPPSLEGTVVRPGVWGGANWGGGAFDPETGMLFVKTARSLGIFAIRKFDPSEQLPGREGEVDADYVQRSLPAGLHGRAAAQQAAVRPPGRASISTGRHRVEGAVRRHGRAAEASGPRRYCAAGPAWRARAGRRHRHQGWARVRGSGDMALSAFDKMTGKEVWSTPLAEAAQATPMTFRSSSGRQFVVIATGRAERTSLVAFALD